MTRYDTARIGGNPAPRSEIGGRVGIKDSLIVRVEETQTSRLAGLLGAAAAGSAAGLALSSFVGQPAVLPVLCALALVGGLLSTWSPCGYSSLSLLRPQEPYSARTVAAWLPTLAAHAAGYLAGGLVLGAALGCLAWLLPSAALSEWVLAVLGSLAISLALDRFRLIRMPYPQRRAQVPHQARLQLPMWRVGLLYGWQLGLNFVTYVRTPVLYVIVLAALLSGSVATAVLLVLILNLGRFLPMLVNLLPVRDWTVQRWLATHEQDAISADAFALSFCGAMFVVLGLY